MSSDPPTQAFEAERLRLWVAGVEVSPGNTNPNCKFSARIFIDDELACNLPWVDHTRPLQWSGLLPCEVSHLSTIALRLCRSVKDKPRYFNFPSFMVSEVDDETGESILELPESAWVVTIKSLTPLSAEKWYPHEVDRLDAIEGVYNSLESSTNVKYLFKSTLQFARLVAETLPESTAKLSFLIYMKAWELLDQQTEIDDTVQVILHSLPSIGDIVEIASQASSSMLATAMYQAKEAVSAILALLEDLSVYIFNRYTTNDLVHIPLEDTEPHDAYDIEAYSTRLEELQKSFHASWSAATVSQSDSAHVVDNELSDTTDPDAQTTLEELTMTTEIYETLDLLRPVEPSGYDPNRACLDGTREAVLNRIITWTQNRDNSESFMWISGQVGMGKTAIATSLCQRLDQIRALAGAFFCQRNNPDASDPLRLINSVAHEMAMHCPPYAHEVFHAISKNRKLYNVHLGPRFEGLVKRPLQRLRSFRIPMTQVVVIDGLDECGDGDSRERILQRLYEMSRLVPWLKVVFTARPLGAIQKYIQANCPRGTVVHLQDYDASSDIRAYTTGQLGPLAEEECWPRDSINRLGTAAEGVFLWSVLATRYIKESTLPGLSRLRSVLKNQQSPVRDYFDTLYSSALRGIMANNDKDTKDAYFRFLGAILATPQQEPLTVPELQGLLLMTGRINQLTFERIMKNLGPILYVTNGQYVKFHHSSFREFITNSSRSGNFFIQLDRYDTERAECCLEVMQRELKFNLCGIETSHLLNSEVADLKLRVKTHIGPALKYACMHWVDHLLASPNQKLVDATKRFLEGPQVLYWIEVLSLLGCMEVAAEGLTKLMLLESFDGGGQLVSWTKDAHRLFLSFYDVIAASTPHLYVSALAFAPTKSLTAQRMRQFFPNTIKVVQGGDKTWHPCVKSILHPHPVQSLSISPGGSMIIVGYSNGSLGTWDAQTGACIGELLVGHRGSVTCIAFAPHGSLVASSSCDTTIRIWDASDRLKALHVLTGHTGSVNAVAFSPDSTVVASGSFDKTIRLWDPKVGCVIGVPYIGHSSRVSSLAFSPDGTKLASGSWDKTIRVWSVDIRDRKLTGDPLMITGHADSVTCIAFSPDGSKIASGSVDKTVRVWGLQMDGKAESVAPPGQHSDSVTSITFTSDGKLIVSSSLDGAIHVRNAVTLGSIIRQFGHFNPVNGVVHSRNGPHLISGSTDKTTRIWDIGASAICFQPMTTSPIVGHSSTVRSVAASSDGTRVISGSCDGTVRMWDAQRGTLVGNPFTGHSNEVLCVALSPDGTRIVSGSGSGDNTVKLWDTTTHTIVYSYQNNVNVQCVAFSPDGNIIAFGSHDSKVYLWEPTEWRIIGAALLGHTNHVLSVAFSPNGELLASAGDSTVIFWDVKTQCRSGVPLSGHTASIISVSFSPCGSRLASGSDDKTVRLWDIKTGNALHVISGHSTYVTTVAFSPDGSTVASGSWDNTVRLWDSQTGQVIGQQFSGHSGYVWSIAFSPDGQYVISGSADNTIRVWSVGATRPAPTPTPEPADRPTGGFSWPTNPHGLSSHPRRHGWVTHDQNSLVFWMPAHYQQPDQFWGNDAQVPSPGLYLDYSTFVHGTAWTNVACDSTRNGSG